MSTVTPSRLVHIMRTPRQTFFADSSQFRRRRMGFGLGLALLLSCAVLGGCAAVQRAPIQTVPNVDLERFMGDWSGAERHFEEAVRINQGLAAPRRERATARRQA